MTFRRMIAVLVAFVLATLPAIGREGRRETLFFLNYPESVERPALMARESVKTGDRARFFFHYKNATSRNLNFTFNVTSPLQSASVGYSVNFQPGLAGSAAAAEFLKSVRMDRQVAIFVTVPAGHTVSGIVDGVFKQSGEAVARMGVGSPAEGIRIITASVIEETVRLDVTDSASVRMGTRREDRIPGDFGATFGIEVRNAALATRTIDVKISPRGGPIDLPFLVSGKVARSGYVPSKQSRTIHSVTLTPGAVMEMKVMIPGGWNLPLDLYAVAR
jgi:hypothetical protein